MTTESFAQRLKRLRIQARMSQTDLSSDEISASYISLLESGKRHPSDHAVRILARRLGCDVSALHQRHPDTDDERHSELELGYCRFALAHGEAIDARDRLEQLLQRPHLSVRLRDEAQYHLARAYERLGDKAQVIVLTRALYDRCLELSTQLSIAVVGLDLCRVYCDVEDYNRAIAVGEETLAVLDRQGLSCTDEYYRLAATILAAYSHSGDLVYAAAWGKNLLAQAREDSDPQGQASIYWNVALVSEQLGRYDEALDLIERALGLMSENGSSLDLAELRVTTALLLLETSPNRAGEAWHILETARDLIDDLGSGHEQMYWRRVAAIARIHQGLYAEAEELARSASFIQGDAYDVAEVYLTWGDAVQALGREDEALDCYRQAREQLRQVPASRSAAIAWRNLGDRWRDRDATESSYCYERSLVAVGITDRSSPIRAAIAAAVREPMVTRLL